MAASIFISYAGRDLKTAGALCQALEGAGFSCWMASRDVPPGENFQIAIVRAIRAAQVMVLVFTHHSNHSEEVAKELALASQTRLPVVPLRMEEVSPNEAFAYEFATRQWIDFYAGWDAGLAQLRQRLAATLEPALTPSVEVVSLAAPRPPRAMRKRSRLGLVLALILIGAAALAGYVVVAPRLKPAAATPAAPPPIAAKPAPAQTNDVPF